MTVPPPLEAGAASNVVMDHLIPIINKLQDAFASVGLAGLDLPQIAVVGAQSSGKSSVLESIVGRDFLPRGSGIVTRRPLVLQLINTPKGAQEYGVFLHQGERKYPDFNAIRAEIQAETDRTTGSNKGISAIPINLKIYSPNVIDLTLIDLPGVTKVPIGDQPVDIEELIRGMVLQFIERESCLILAVSPANTDLANSDALQLARFVDPEGHRTIGVITKLDLMDEGTDALEILNNQTFKMRHGFVGVVNRSQKEITQNKDIGSALKKEEEWFAQHPVYKSVKDRSGTGFLREKLRSTLIAHIKKTLPELKQRLHKRLGDVTRELAIMNSPFDGIDERLLKKDRATGNVSEMGVDPVAMQNVLMNVVRKFCSTIKLIIDGHDGDLNSDAFGDLNFVTGRMHQFSLDSGTEQAPPVSPLELNTAVRIKFVFLERFPQTLMRLEDLLLSSEMDAELRTMILNARGLRAGLFVPDSVLEILIKRHVLQLEPIAIECVNAIHSEINNMLDQILFSRDSPIRVFPKLSQWIRDVASRMLDECQEDALAEVKRLIRMETSYINTGHPDFLARDGISNWFMEQQQQMAVGGSTSSLPQSAAAKKSHSTGSAPLHMSGSTRGKMSGYLTKMGGSRRSWKSRYFVLADGCVSFREDENSSEKGSFSLTTCLVRDLVTKQLLPDNGPPGAASYGSDEASYRDRPFAFEIFSADGSVLLRNHRSLLLCAESEAEKLQWVRAISDAILSARAGQRDAAGAAGRIPGLQAPPPFGSVASSPITRKPPSHGMLADMPSRMYGKDLNDATGNQTFTATALGAGGPGSSVFDTADNMTVLLVRMLLHSYFVIVRKHIQDLVPKAIMYMMVGRLKNELPSVLTGKILSGDEHEDATTGLTTKINVLDLLAESPEVREARKQKSNEVRMVKEALAALDREILDFN